MSNLIPVVQLDKDEEPKAISNIKVERPLEEEDAQTLAKMPWREYLRRAGYNKDADKMCELCIKEQKEKYNGRTPIVCNGYRDFSTILREKYGDVADELTASLSEAELNILKAEFDPKAWFETYARDVTKLQDRYYQTQILKCSAKNKVIRAGRRCVAKGELVCMADGSFKPIEDVKKGDKVLSHKGGELVSSEVYNTMNNGMAPVFQIKTQKGFTLKVTEDHQLKVKAGWKALDEGLSVGDEICTTDSKTIVWDQIESIEPIGEEEVYDISVAKTANFIANGVVVHNCGKTFAIAMYVLARIGQATEPLEVLVAAPGLGQIEEIKQTVETLADNLDIPGFITSSKQAPYLQINFYNGCKIKGITTGKDGKGSRGKRADILWLDEVDFIPADAMTAVLGVMLDNPHVERIYTSTPIGHKHLFEFASKPSTKEFHFPSFARPDYDDNMHNETTEFTDIRYCQEVLGVYGVDASGVFPLSYIKKSFDNFIPHFYNKNFVLNNRERFLVFIGVDWNHDNNGTRILVVGYDKEVGRFFKIEGFKIAKLQMTQALAVDTVVQVNREFNADHILCDQGFGTAQISQLRLKGQEQYGKVPPDHPDLKLVDTISVDFGSSLTITDPTSKQPLKRNTKQYIVEHAQKLLEDNKLALHQDQDHDLIEQLKSYVVARTGMRGTIYKAGDKKIGDHDLDAFMLALYGFDYFYGEFISPHVAGYASVIGTGDYRYAAANRSLSEIGSTFRTGRTKSARAGTPKRARSRAF